MEDKLTKTIFDLRTQAKSFPHQPGVYLMKSTTDTILYIGKAKDLRKRVLSYFSRNKDIKTRLLISKVATIEFILTSAEYEALLLEHSLIKKHRPQYNISLKDGKTYPVIRITAEKYPRVIKTRRIIHDGSTYFGPFPQAQMVTTYLDLIQRLFPLRRCKTMRPRKSPCFYFHIQRCAAVCAEKISHADYLQRVQSIRRLLSGKKDVLITQLNKKMAAATEKMEYEQAAEIRDTIQSILELHSEQKMTDFNLDARDYIGYVDDATKRIMVILQMRGGNLVGTNVYSLHAPSTDDVLSSFIVQHYQSLHNLPKTIYVQKELEDRKSLEEFFHQNRGTNVHIMLPSTAQDARRIHMAINNAWMELQSNRPQEETAALADLQKLLHLPRLPQHIEGIDIAHVDGKYPVASLVVCKQGKPLPSQYRKYHIKNLPKGKIDDFAAIREVVIRRYTRMKNENCKMPDLILIDGGKGQLHAAMDGLRLLQLSQLPLAALAKKQELLYIPDSPDPIDLPDGNPALRIVQLVRDESHRFATQFRRTLQHKALSQSLLRDIPGVGPSRARKILEQYPDITELIHSPDAIIAKSIAIPLSVIQNVQAYLRKNAPFNDEVLS